jgi:hypothetical protein
MAKGLPLIPAVIPKEGLLAPPFFSCHVRECC